LLAAPDAAPVSAVLTEDVVGIWPIIGFDRAELRELMGDA